MDRKIEAIEDALTPQQIVEELDRYIIGQNKGKKAVAVALRNRWRRKQLSTELRDEVMPKNIILMGPTGVGKTEIARRLANLTQSPFIKVEATKFTEVGYVGRDVESMVRDLVDLAANMVKSEMRAEVEDEAKALAEEKLLELLLHDAVTQENTKEKMRQKLRSGKLEEQYIEIETQTGFMGAVEVFSSAGMEELGLQLKDMASNMFPKSKQQKKKKIREARSVIEQEEAQKLIDMDAVIEEAIARVEESGIIFLDEIDKIAKREGGHGPDVSREGVQRDILPMVEGTKVPTKYGLVRTDHILFLAAGAFHMSKPSDLIPELQGRFPIRVELSALTADDFVKILTEPENALVKQYIELLKTEGVELRFSDDAIKEIARSAASVNERAENIGARRLQTVMEFLLEEISFNATSMKGTTQLIDEKYVAERLKDIVEDEDLSRYIL